MNYYRDNSHRLVGNTKANGLVDISINWCHSTLIKKKNPTTNYSEDQLMRTSDEQQQYIQDLSNALEQLRLAQANVDGVIARIRTRGEPQQQAGVRVTERRKRSVHPLSNLCVGDRVRINKPKDNQQDIGVVFGSTRSALIRVRTPNGQEVKRLTKNLTVIQRHKNE